MSTKTIRSIIPSEKVNMGGHIIEQPLPAKQLDYFDPFLLIHHWESTLPGDQSQRDVGIGPHPHVGFSPVTFIFQGAVHHQDSLGNSAVINAGGTQWMFAGKGITHSERPSKQMAENGGEQEIIQFWVNAPAANKRDPAFYKPISKEETPTVLENGLELQVVCGEYKGTKGNLEYYSDLLLLRGTIKSESSFNLKLKGSHNSIIYLLDGKLEVNGKEVKRKDMIVFNQDGDTVSVKAIENTRFIVLSGEPLNEPVVTHGPFVMNNQTEIMRAFRDAQMGKLGVLIEEFE